MLKMLTKELSNQLKISKLTVCESIDSYNTHYLTVVCQLDFKSMQHYLGKLLHYQSTYNNYTNNYQGYLTHILEFSSNDKNFYHYRLTTLCWLGLLTKDHSQRLFNSINTLDIIYSICDSHKFPKPCAKNIVKKLKVRILTTQFNESTQHFIQRILQEEHLHFYMQQNSMILFEKIHQLQGPLKVSCRQLKAQDQCLWNWRYLDKQRQYISAFCNYPQLKLGQRLDVEGPQLSSKNYIVTRLITTITDDINKGYCKSLRARSESQPLEHQIHFKTPRIYGIYRGTVIEASTTLRIQPYWNSKQQTINNAMLLKEHTSQQFQPLPGDEVLIQYQQGLMDKPNIIGSIYNAKNRSPFTNSKTQQYCGYRSPAGQYWKAGNNHEIYASKALAINTRKKLNLSCKNNTKYHLKKSFDINVPTGSINIKATNEITLKCGESEIVIKENKISIKSKKINLKTSE